MTIHLGNDHAGYLLKTQLSLFIALEFPQFKIENYGIDNTTSVDYPEIVHTLVPHIIENDKGILICGSANGMSMTANKYKHIRSGIAWNKEIAALLRKHNDANIICLPSRYIDLETAKSCVFAFLTNAFEGGRHHRRVEKIHNNYCK